MEDSPNQKLKLYVDAQRHGHAEFLTALHIQLPGINHHDLLTLPFRQNPKAWVSSHTYPCKANEMLRVCLDPKDLNKAIIYKHNKALTLEEHAHKLEGSSIYSKLGAKMDCGVYTSHTKALY